MPDKQYINKTSSADNEQVTVPETNPSVTLQQPIAPVIQRAMAAPKALTSGDILKLQRAVGNRATSSLLTGMNQLPGQTKLEIGRPGDRYEQEADQTAAKVVAQIHTDSPVLQTKTAANLVSLGSMIQAKSSQPVQEYNPMPDLETSIKSEQGKGSSLPVKLQGKMENAFGADFSSVRIHTGQQANQLNNSLGSRAFTTGSDIFFKQGEYRPDSRPGQELMAHELTHVVQQKSGLKIQCRGGNKQTSPVSYGMGQQATILQFIDTEGKTALENEIRSAVENQLAKNVETQSRVYVDKELGIYGDAMGYWDCSKEGYKLREHLKMKAREEAKKSVQEKFKSIAGFKGDKEGELTKRASKLEEAAIKKFSLEANNFVINSLRQESAKIVQVIKQELLPSGTITEDLKQKLTPGFKDDFIRIISQKGQENLDATLNMAKQTIIEEYKAKISTELYNIFKNMLSIIESSARQKAAQARDNLNQKLNNQSEKIIDGSIFSSGTNQPGGNLEKPSDKIAEIKDERSDLEKQADLYLYGPGNEDAPEVAKKNAETVTSVSAPSLKDLVKNTSYNVAKKEMGYYGGFIGKHFKSNKKGYALRKAFKDTARQEGKKLMSTKYQAKGEFHRENDLNKGLTAKAQLLEAKANIDVHDEAKKFVIEVIDQESLKIADKVVTDAVINNKNDIISSLKVPILATMRDRFDHTLGKSKKPLSDSLLVTAKEQSKLAASLQAPKERDKKYNEMLSDIQERVKAQAEIRRNQIINEAKIGRGSSGFQSDDPTATVSYLDSTHKTRDINKESFAQMVQSKYKDHIEAPDTNKALKIYAQGINKIVPDEGDSCSIDVTLRIPVFAQSGIFIFFHFNGEAEHEEKNHLKNRNEMGIGVEGNVYWAKLAGELGGYTEVQAQGPDKLALLMSYLIYRRFRESPVMPQGVTNKLWGMGGKSGKTKREEAEIWGAAVEEEVFQNDDDAYAEIGGYTAVKAEASFGKLGFLEGIGAEAGFKGTLGKKYSKETLGNKLGKTENELEREHLDQQKHHVVASQEIGGGTTLDFGVVQAAAELEINLKEDWSKKGLKKFAGFEVSVASGVLLPLGGTLASNITAGVGALLDLIKTIYNRFKQKKFLFSPFVNFSADAGMFSLQALNFGEAFNLGELAQGSIGTQDSISKVWGSAEDSILDGEGKFWLTGTFSVEDGIELSLSLDLEQAIGMDAIFVAAELEKSKRIFKFSKEW